MYNVCTCQINVLFCSVLIKRVCGVRSYTKLPLNTKPSLLSNIYYSASKSFLIPSKLVRALLFSMILNTCTQFNHCNGNVAVCNTLPKIDVSGICYAFTEQLYNVIFKEMLNPLQIFTYTFKLMFDVFSVNFAAEIHFEKSLGLCNIIQILQSSSDSELNTAKCSAGIILLTDRTCIEHVSSFFISAPYADKNTSVQDYCHVCA